MSNENLYYIRSAKHDRNNTPGDDRALWWRAEQRGYTYDLNQAGRYGFDDAQAICGPHNQELVGNAWMANNVMVPVRVATSLSIRTVNRFDLPANIELAVDSLTP